LSSEIGDKNGEGISNRGNRIREKEKGKKKEEKKKEEKRRKVKKKSANKKKIVFVIHFNTINERAN